MENIKVNVHVSCEVALKACAPIWGDFEHHPTAEQLAELTEAERDWLGGHLRDRFTLDAARVEWPTVLKAIRAKRQAEVDKREKAIADALARPDGEWFSVCYGEPVLSLPWLAPELKSDPRIVAKVESLKPELARRVAEHKAEAAERTAREEADRAARKRKEAETKAQHAETELTIREWAANHDWAPLARAAKEGYPIVNEVLEHVADDIASALGGEVSHEGQPSWSRWDFVERAAPTLQAFESWDEAKALVDAMHKPAAQLKPAAVKVSLERIARVTMQPDPDDCDGEVEHFTAVLVFVGADLPGANTRCVMVRTE